MFSFFIPSSSSLVSQLFLFFLEFLPQFYYWDFIPKSFFIKKKTSPPICFSGRCSFSVVRKKRSVIDPKKQLVPWSFLLAYANLPLVYIGPLPLGVVGCRVSGNELTEVRFCLTGLRVQPRNKSPRPLQGIRRERPRNLIFVGKCLRYKIMITPRPSPQWWLA